MVSAATPLSYTPLQPIRIDNPASPTCLKVSRFVGFLIVGACFGATLSITVGVSIGASFILSTLVGSLVGSVSAAVSFFFIKQPSPLTKYRQETLEQLESAQSDPDLLVLLKQLKSDFKSETLQLKQNFELHRFYDRLTLATRLLSPKRPDHQSIWKLFLTRVSGFKIVLPDGNTHTFNSSALIECIEKKQPPFTLSKLDPQNEPELKRVEEIFRLSLGRNYTPPVQKMRELLAQDNRNCCHLLKRADGGIVGCAFSEIHKMDAGEVRQIRGIARAPEQAIGGIGKRLLHAVIQESPDLETLLQVRKSNLVAHRLYRFSGFEEIKPLPAFYKEPEEEGLLMRRQPLSKAALA